MRGGAQRALVVETKKDPNTDILKQQRELLKSMDKNIAQFKRTGDYVSDVDNYAEVAG